MGCKVEIELPKDSKLIPQTIQCQAYGHTHRGIEIRPQGMLSIQGNTTLEIVRNQEKPNQIGFGSHFG